MSYSVVFGQIKDRCSRGTKQDIDEVIGLLNETVDLPTTKAIDFYLGRVTNPEGTDRIAFYLFQGSQIQRNYCTLYFARRNEWNIVNEAYNSGGSSCHGALIAEQAYNDEIIDPSFCKLSSELLPRPRRTAPLMTNNSTDPFKCSKKRRK